MEKYSVDLVDSKFREGLIFSQTPNTIRKSKIQSYIKK
jgi:hypothetical protein